MTAVPRLMERNAVLDEAKKYRYDLWRIWDSAKPLLGYVMLNPSTADWTHDDPTIRKCIGFADRLGYGGFHVVNLFAYRATDPDDLPKLSSVEAIGPENDQHLLRVTAMCEKIICAWGNGGQLHKRSTFVRHLLKGRPLYSLKINASTAEPAHPLYLKYTLTPQPWS